ncbi:Peptidase M20 domain-containing protein 2 [Hypsibius exemplaris]|uniref:Peptidase M20 domain-containing protein 2 n=1 Tax=Hypsibius exemplaris TaxID=2072580 RepID=A0A9X6NMJ4_HYPEX|nr:Peptidase M20 domain-containing protein 2 [Hypsibius exemplaris]
MSSSAVYEKVVRDSLERNKDSLNDISQDIWKNPEQKFEEFFAHSLLTDFLEHRGFTVARAYKQLKTAFRAEFQSANYKQGEDPTIAVLCEYDALPEIGHACGHNLIAEAGVATGLAVQDVLRNLTTQDEQPKVEGKIVVLGTPAEEGGGGKVILVREGAFEDIDFAMMVHPAYHNDLEPVILGVDMCEVEFQGKAAHAACGPWEGLNALDAAVAVYQNIALYRQQMKPDWRVHGVILNGGAKPNIIPDCTVSSYFIRARTISDLAVLKANILEIFHSAAEATGCTVKVTWEENPYTGMMHSSAMACLYRTFSAGEGVIFPDFTVSVSGSTDMGNVSLEVPSIHPKFFAGQPLMIHSRDFQRLAGSPEAQRYTLIAAKAMALTCVELFTNRQIRDQVLHEFTLRKATFTG